MLSSLDLDFCHLLEPGVYKSQMDVNRKIREQGQRQKSAKTENYYRQIEAIITMNDSFLDLFDVWQWGNDSDEKREYRENIVGWGSRIIEMRASAIAPHTYTRGYDGRKVRGQGGCDRVVG